MKLNAIFRVPVNRKSPSSFTLLDIMLWTIMSTETKNK